MDEITCATLSAIFRGSFPTRQTLMFLVRRQLGWLGSALLRLLPSRPLGLPSLNLLDSLASNEGQRRLRHASIDIPFVGAWTLSHEPLFPSVPCPALPCPHLSITNLRKPSRKASKFTQSKQQANHKKSHKNRPISSHQPT